MAHCPFATWYPISGSSGAHRGGPYKIVHHTTEGATADGALKTFRIKRADPHFTVDATTIYQHIDTAEGARALRNDAGGVQTNRDSAVQIELVGFAHLAKDPKALANVARLCRWIEQTHGVPRVWPNGLPRPAKNGKDPGGHNRDATTWDTQAGHYGHCHVPENTHWDPGFTADEVTFLMAATFDAEGKLIALPAPSKSPKRGKKVAARAPRRATVTIKGVVSTMPDHADAPVGITAYIGDLPLADVNLPTATPARAPKRVAARGRRKAPSTSTQAAKEASAVVNVGSVVSFVAGISAQEMEDVLYSVQLAQRGASGAFDRFTQTRAWYQKYLEILENLGWASEQLAFKSYEQKEGEFRMDKAALGIIAAIATQNQLAALNSSLDALGKLAEKDGTISLLDFHASADGSGNFQIGSVERTDNGALAIALGAFYFKGVDERRRFLFFKWGKREVEFWTAAQRLTLNSAFYAKRREAVAARLDADANTFIAELPLGI